MSAAPNKDCPECGKPLKVEPRGADFIAYCPGTEGWNGCYGEFGETGRDAIIRVRQVHEEKNF